MRCLLACLFVKFISYIITLPDHFYQFPLIRQERHSAGFIYWKNIILWDPESEILLSRHLPFRTSYLPRLDYPWLSAFQRALKIWICSQAVEFRLAGPYGMFIVYQMCFFFYLSTYYRFSIFFIYLLFCIVFLSVVSYPESLWWDGRWKAVNIKINKYWQLNSLDWTIM